MRCGVRGGRGSGRERKARQSLRSEIGVDGLTRTDRTVIGASSTRNRERLRVGGRTSRDVDGT